MQDQLSVDGCVERGSEQLVEVEDGLGGQRPAASTAVETQPPVQGGELVGVELAELDMAEVGEQVVLDRSDVPGLGGGRQRRLPGGKPLAEQVVPQRHR